VNAWGAKKGLSTQQKPTNPQNQQQQQQQMGQKITQHSPAQRPTLGQHQSQQGPSSNDRRGSSIREVSVCVSVCGVWP
jgi:hypothetical protein